MRRKRETRRLLVFNLRSLFLVTVVVAVYLSSYIALVERRPVYRGNNLRQLRLAIVHANIDASHTLNSAQPVEYVRPDPPDGYAVKYRLDQPCVKTIYQPIHWIDRKLRPDYWPVPTYWGC